MAKRPADFDLRAWLQSEFVRCDVAKWSADFLAFGHNFNQSLARVTPPSGLQTLTFGHDFNQNLAGVTLPSGLQTLAFGHNFNQSLTDVPWPSGLQTLTFGHDFNQNLAGVTLPSGLQTLAFGHNFNQSLTDVPWPSGLQTLTFGHDFNQSLSGVTLPSGLQTFWPLGITSIRVWHVWHRQAACRLWPSGMSSIRVWQVLHGQAPCKLSKIGPRDFLLCPAVWVDFARAVCSWPYSSCVSSYCTVGFWKPTGEGGAGKCAKVWNEIMEATALFGIQIIGALILLFVYILQLRSITLVAFPNTIWFTLCMFYMVDVSHVLIMSSSCLMAT